MGAQTVRAKLLQKLNEMQNLKAAFDFETSNPDGKYPFATVTFRSGKAEFGSTAHNIRTHGFRIKVYQERAQSGQGPENAEDIIANLLDEVYTAFDMDTTLSGTVKYVQPAQWQAGYVDRELDTRILEIDLDAIEVVNSR